MLFPNTVSIIIFESSGVIFKEKFSISDIIKSSESKISKNFLREKEDKT